MPKKRPEVPTHLDPGELTPDAECTFSNNLADGLIRTIKKHYGACSDYEVVGALEYVKRYYMGGGCAWPGTKKRDEGEGAGT